MSPPDTAPPWRFRLQLITGLALLVLVILLLRSRRASVDIESRRSAMQGALRTLLAAQESYHTAHGGYATTLDSLRGFSTPPGLVLRFAPRDRTSWGAVVSDSSLPVLPRHCGIFAGGEAASPHRAVIYPGVPACW